MVKPKKKFDPKRAPGWQVRSRVDRVSKLIIKQMAGGNIESVNRGMIEAMAKKQNLPTQQLIDHLRSLGARI